MDTTPDEQTHQCNKLQDNLEHTLRGNYCHEEHSNVCHGISNDNTESDIVLKVEVLPSVITNTEVDNCDSISDFKTQRREKETFDGIWFMNRHKDTRGLC